MVKASRRALSRIFFFENLTCLHINCYCPAKANSTNQDTNSADPNLADMGRHDLSYSSGFFWRHYFKLITSSMNGGYGRHNANEPVVEIMQLSQKNPAGNDVCNHHGTAHA